VVCPQCVMTDVHSTLLCSAQNFDRENVSGKMPDKCCNPFKMLGVRDGRGSCNSVTGKCHQMSLWKKSLGRDRVLYKNDGHIRKTISQKLREAVQA
jgi:hypothetical protein